LCYSYHAHSYIRYINRQMHSVKYSTIQIIKYNSVPKHVWFWYLSWNVFYNLYFVVFYWVHLLADILNLHYVIFSRSHLFCHSSSYVSYSFILKHLQFTLLPQGRYGTSQPRKVTVNTILIYNICHTKLLNLLLQRYIYCLLKTVLAPLISHHTTDNTLSLCYINSLK